MKLAFLFISICIVSSSYAQYNNYGGGGYGGGRMGGNQMGGMGMQDMDSGKPKAALDPDEIAQEETKYMVKKLKLDDEQEIIISSLNEDYAYQRKDLYDQIKKEFGETRPSPQQIDKAKAKMEGLEEKKTKELEKILRLDQFKTYMAIKAKREKEAKRN